MPGKKIVWLCLCAFRFVHRRFASRRVSAAGWGKPGIHQFKPNKSSLSPAPSFIVVIVSVTHMAVAHMAVARMATSGRGAPHQRRGWLYPGAGGSAQPIALIFDPGT